MSLMVAIHIACTAARGDTASFLPSKDNTLIQHTTGANSGGLSDSIYSGRTGSNGNFTRRRAVLAFDVPAAIPRGSTINSASLTLLMVQTVSGPNTHTLHRILADWGEGTSSDGGGQGGPATPDSATWLHRFWPDVLWTAAGGQFDATPSDSIVIDQSGLFYTWESPAMAADVQAWLDDPAGSFGWLIRGNEIQTNTSKKFASREWPVETERPVLVIDYTPPRPRECPADCVPAGGDGEVDIDDLFAVIAAFGSADSACDIAPPGGNGVIDIDDLFAVIAVWGPCP